MPTAAAATTPARHATRATRDGGRRTRSALLDAATDLFAKRGLAGVSLADIATAADAFPSQVTYYFGSKEALFVEAACREVLHLAGRVELKGRRAADMAAYGRVMAAEALASPALLTFAEALLLARQRRELEPLVARTLDRLHREGARAVAERCAENGWVLQAQPPAIARGFWAVVLGLVLQRAGSGGSFDLPSAESAVLATLTAEYPASAAAPASRRRRPRRKVSHAPQ